MGTKVRCARGPWGFVPEAGRAEAQAACVIPAG